MSRAMPIGLTMIATMALLTPETSAGGSNCFSDWSVAAPIVKKEGLATVEVLTAMAREKLQGSIVKTVLCEDNGRFFYRVVVRDEKGQLRNVSVDARKPFGR